MIAKRLEFLLAEAAQRGESEMVQRFQKLRDFGFLPTSRGKNADALTIEQIVPAILSIISDKPGQAGIAAKVLISLVPVGGKNASFSAAENFGHALQILLSHPAELANIIEVRVTYSEVATKSRGRATILCQHNGVEMAHYYVRKEAVSLLQPGSEVTYDPRAVGRKLIEETIFPKEFFELISRKVQEDERYARLTKH